MKKKLLLMCLIAFFAVACTKTDEKVQLSTDESAALKLMQSAVLDSK